MRGWRRRVGRVGVECRVSWLVIRSSLPSRSLQGNPAWHSVRHQREDVRWGMREKESEWAVKSQSAWDIHRDKEKELGERERRRADTYKQTEKGERDPNTKTKTKCDCMCFGPAPGVSRLAAAEQSNHMELYKISCWSMEKWVPPQQSIGYWQIPAGLWICFSAFYMGLHCKNHM